ncbi:small secreted protein [Pluteus cervinus]|uniref:Small secreted protein n=1 Tax=Pluteus cervinus TaxID=181527 RepID=A0ACD3ALT4_9AGAR|nr:small secreted protein [Pluteus cervinus]
MPVPWEALIPFALVTAMFGAAGTLLGASTRGQNEGKPPRYNLDRWEHMMMTRDQRLTGTKRTQSTETVAPPEFATNSVWHTQQTS